MAKVHDGRVGRALTLPFGMATVRKLAGPPLSGPPIPLPAAEVALGDLGPFLTRSQLMQAFHDHFDLLQLGFPRPENRLPC